MTDKDRKHIYITAAVIAAVIIFGALAAFVFRDAEGWRVVADNLDRECVPLWPHQAYAELYATDVFAGSHPEPIPLDTFMARWLPGMAQDGRFAAVFPTPLNKGIIVAPMELHLHLAAEMKKYE